MRDISNLMLIIINIQRKIIHDKLEQLLLKNLEQYNLLMILWREIIAFSIVYKVIEICYLCQNLGYLYATFYI